MEVTPGEDAVIGDADLFDFLKVEEALAVSESVQGHHAHGRSVRIGNGELEHRVTRGKFVTSEQSAAGQEAILQSYPWHSAYRPSRRDRPTRAA